MLNAQDVTGTCASIARSVNTETMCTDDVHHVQVTSVSFAQFTPCSTIDTKQNMNTAILDVQLANGQTVRFSGMCAASCAPSIYSLVQALNCVPDNRIRSCSTAPSLM
jgi:hypothetical protein